MPFAQSSSAGTLTRFCRSSACAVAAKAMHLSSVVLPAPGLPRIIARCGALAFARILSAFRGSLSRASRDCRRGNSNNESMRAFLMPRASAKPVNSIRECCSYIASRYLRRHVWWSLTASGWMRFSSSRHQRRSLSPAFSGAGAPSASNSLRSSSPRRFEVDGGEVVIADLLHLLPHVSEIEKGANGLARLLPLPAREFLSPLASQVLPCRPFLVGEQLQAARLAAEKFAGGADQDLQGKG